MAGSERILVGDTETTGIPFSEERTGHRMVEIGLVEMVGNLQTGRRFHVYLNPGRKVDPEAVKVHGLTDDILKDKPRFRDVVDEFDDFVRDDPLVFHNASFDMGFIRGERNLLRRAPLRNEVRDSLAVARRMYPGQRSSLDALCSRLGVDNTGRTLHGALLDASILADVWVRMMGLDRLDLGSGTGHAASPAPQAAAAVPPMLPRRPRPTRPPLLPAAAEAEAFEAFMAKAVKDSIWARLAAKTG